MHATNRRQRAAPESGVPEHSHLEEALCTDGLVTADRPIYAGKLQETYGAVFKLRATSDSALYRRPCNHIPKATLYLCTLLGVGVNTIEAGSDLTVLDQPSQLF